MNALAEVVYLMKQKRVSGMVDLQQWRIPRCLCEMINFCCFSKRSKDGSQSSHEIIRTKRPFALNLGDP